ncbi:MAG: lipid-A-disaccharide synthase [Chitinophagaceae bacterium]|nr:lipid-A-disaccharide synthase [Chitinophagaceae bacterium]
MKYYIIAGEASGDLHGSNLIHELKRKDAAAVIRCWGGEKMRSAGGEVVKHIDELAFMGFAEVIKNLRAILKNFRFCKKDILAFQPDALILIDYPGFNLRMARWAKKNKLKVIYYISPQVWAWKESRVKLMKRCIDKMLVILPFEKEYYKKRWDWEVEFVGHPLIAEIENSLLQSASEEPLSEKPVIALLPGSRKQEIKKKLPVMLRTSRNFPQYQFIVAGAPSVNEDFYKEILKDYPEVKSLSGKTYSILRQAKAALVTSGTATLETALLGTPQIVCYKGSPLSYFIGKKLVKVKYISLVNLILNKPVVKELIQNELTPENLTTELKRLLDDNKYRETMLQDYDVLRTMLAEKGNASSHAADIIWRFLSRTED